MQTTLTAGDTLNYPALVPDYPASAGWALKLRLVPRGTTPGSGVATTITAVADGDGYRVQVSAAVTATWAAGPYTWSSWVEKAGERYTQQSGQITVLPDPAAMAAGTDTRTHAAKVLDAVESVLEGRASQSHLELEIAGRKLKFIPMAELLAVRDRYRWEVRNQQAAATGQPGAGKMLVRL
jgi:hypothetical protein